MVACPSLATAATRCQKRAHVSRLTCRCGFVYRQGDPLPQNIKQHELSQRHRKHLATQQMKADSSLSSYTTTNHAAFTPISHMSLRPRCEIPLISMPSLTFPLTDTHDASLSPTLDRRLSAGASSDASRVSEVSVFVNTVESLAPLVPDKQALQGVLQNCAVEIQRLASSNCSLPMTVDTHSGNTDDINNSASHITRLTHQRAAENHARSTPIPSLGVHRRDCFHCGAMLTEVKIELPLCYSCIVSWRNRGSPPLRCRWSERGASLKELRQILHLAGVRSANKNLTKARLFNRIASLYNGGPPVISVELMSLFYRTHEIPVQWHPWCSSVGISCVSTC